MIKPRIDHISAIQTTANDGFNQRTCF
jgi:hypothetical protein